MTALLSVYYAIINKEILARVYTDEVQERDWRKWRAHKDPRIAWEAFKLAQSYLHGKPVQPLVGVEDSPPLEINVSAIPKHREPAKV
jgi:hypothetical protein